ncbi:glutathione S-transferase family protein [Ovoidimarina sediminis]|uniref:glutathione S-transferase family protein n=1 Tax=Ovoidimarina sediminis TaxID=3079856 RepID=UPI002914E6A0|nr:glutathione S-transferase family protein [Rhodophyticola sp. MJ-SS7]MDU8944330.1 glutathione S-transferase family protein [Rhodophyticola sp. MJ-SS7]
MITNDPILFGRLLSPYVRRVAVSLNLLGIEFSHVVVSAIGDESKREAINPVGRVPALQLSSGEVLIDSAAILDHFDEVVGPERALIPVSGSERRDALRRIAIATGAIDRAMTANAERRRDNPDPVRIDRLLRQCRQGFEALERDQDFFDGARLRQPDITSAVGFTFVNHIFPGTLQQDDLPGLWSATGQAEALAEFRAAQIDAPST